MVYRVDFVISFERTDFNCSASPSELEPYALPSCEGSVQWAILPFVRYCPPSCAHSSSKQMFASTCSTPLDQSPPVVNNYSLILSPFYYNPIHAY